METMKNDVVVSVYLFYRTVFSVQVTSILILGQLPVVFVLIRGAFRS